VLDEGKLTDGKGNKVDFTNTVIILTSNIGSKKILDSFEKLDSSKTITESMKKSIEDNVMKDVRSHFKPEFLNRLDDIIIFEPLTENYLKNIVKIQLKNIINRIESKHINIKLDDKAVELILKDAYNPIYGARPLKRYLEKNIITEMSKLIIKGQLSDYSTVNITTNEENQKLKYVVKNQEPSTKP